MSDPPQSHTGPGLVDLQVNGYAGFDFNGDPAGWTDAAWHGVRRALRRRGVVAVLPTFISAAPDALLARARRYAGLLARDRELAAAFPRLHIEGPFVSPDEGPRGAHALRHCLTPAARPDLIDRIAEASDGRVGIVTLAPELPGALELIERSAAAGVCVALGHTQASPTEIDAAVSAGARLSTHLGNASHQTLPRLDNYIQAQLADDRLWAGFIGDGHHMPFWTLKNFIRAKTVERSALVTDAIMAAELGPGRYLVGEQIVEVTPEGRASQPGQPNLSGSVLTLDVAVMNVARHCAVTFQQAWAMASVNPATIVGLPAPETVTVTITEKGFARQ